MTVIDALLRLKERIKWYVFCIPWYAFLVKYRLPLSLERDPGWSMHPSDVEVIIDVLRGYRTSGNLCLVELGSGFSTLALAHLLPRLHNNGHIVTIEGDDAYANQLRTQITAYDLDNVVNLYHIPYVVGTDECWFDSNALRKIIGDKKVDVLVVDAPPGGFCPHARQNAIPFFLSYLKQNSTVLLHDTIRQDESDIAKQWSRYFHAHHRVKTPSGLDVFERLV